MKDSRRTRVEFARITEHRRIEPNDPSAQQIRRGWSFAAEDFVARLVDRIPGSLSEHHHTRERNQTDEQRAEAIPKNLLTPIAPAHQMNGKPSKTAN